MMQLIAACAAISPMSDFLSQMPWGKTWEETVLLAEVPFSLTASESPVRFPKTSKMQPLAERSFACGVLLTLAVYIPMGW